MCVPDLGSMVNFSKVERALQKIEDSEGNKRYEAQQAHALHVFDVVGKLELPFGWMIQTVGKGNNLFIQVVCESAVCNDTGKHISWKGRKWYISPYMVEGEIIQTCLMATLAAAEHEIRETFKYKGQSIYDGHYDPDKLVELRSQKDSIKGRTNEA